MLRVGARIAVVAPAGRVDPQKLSFALSRLRDCGWSINPRLLRRIHFSTKEPIWLRPSAETRSGGHYSGFWQLFLSLVAFLKGLVTS
jgi:hypothetical protein